MTPIDLITDLFCRIDDEMRSFPKHSQACLWPSAGVTLGGVCTPGKGSVIEPFIAG